LANKRIAPIGSFGGAAAKLLHSAYGLNGIAGAELATQNGPWSNHVLHTTMQVLGVDRQPRLLIIHGRASDRYELMDWLRSTLRLNDLLIMRQEFGGGRTLPEKFESLAAAADGAIAIATPDDFGAPVGTTAAVARARQNVCLEVGWAWGRLGRHRLMVLTKGGVEMPSDLQGLEHYPYHASSLEATEAIRAFVRQLAGSA
jgi:predicted nucleotide-binding protein